MSNYCYNLAKNRLSKKEIEHKKKQVYNYLLQKENIDFRFELPNSYNINHMLRFNWLQHNWQLKEDPTPFFIKHGYLWKYSGFDRKQRNPLMKQTWDIIKKNYE